MNYSLRFIKEERVREVIQLPRGTCERFSLRMIQDYLMIDRWNITLCTVKYRLLKAACIKKLKSIKESKEACGMQKNFILYHQGAD